MEEKIKNILNWVKEKYKTRDVIIRLWDDFSGDVIDVSNVFGDGDIVFAFDNINDVSKEDVDCWEDVDAWLHEENEGA